MAETVAVSGLNTTTYDKMAKIELRAYPNNYLFSPIIPSLCSRTGLNPSLRSRPGSA